VRPGYTMRTLPGPPLSLVLKKMLGVLSNCCLTYSPSGKLASFILMQAIWLLQSAGTVHTTEGPDGEPVPQPSTDPEREKKPPAHILSGTGKDQLRIQHFHKHGVAICPCIYLTPVRGSFSQVVATSSPKTVLTLLVTTPSSARPEEAP
jgi:hypothetical protein